MAGAVGADRVVACTRPRGRLLKKLLYRYLIEHNAFHSDDGRTNVARPASTTSKTTTPRGESVHTSTS